MRSQRAKVSTESPTTVGTKMSAILSTTCCTGAFEPCASCTMRIILANTVFCPTASARKWNVPLLTIVPASTLSPFLFSTATASPVIIDSSTVPITSSALMLLTIVPSTGIFSPGRTSSVSRGCTAEMGISFVSPASTRCAVLGVSPISERMLLAVPCLARSSSSLPVSTKVIIITEASK